MGVSHCDYVVGGGGWGDEKGGGGGVISGGLKSGEVVGWWGAVGEGVRAELQVGDGALN